MLWGILRGRRLVDDSGVARTVLVRGTAHERLDLERAPTAKRELRRREGATDVSSREHLSREQVVRIVLPLLLAPLLFALTTGVFGVSGWVSFVLGLGFALLCAPLLGIARGVLPGRGRQRVVMPLLGAGYCPVCWCDLRTCAPVDRGDGLCACLGCGAAWHGAYVGALIEGEGEDGEEEEGDERGGHAVRDARGVARRVNWGPVGAGVERARVGEDVLRSIGGVALLRARALRGEKLMMAAVWAPAQAFGGAVLVAYALLPMVGLVVGPFWMMGSVLAALVAYAFVVVWPVRRLVERVVWRSYGGRAARLGVCASCGAVVERGECGSCGAVWGV